MIYMPFIAISQPIALIVHFVLQDNDDDDGSWEQVLIFELVAREDLLGDERWIMVMYSHEEAASQGQN